MMMIKRNVIATTFLSLLVSLGILGFWAASARASAADQGALDFVQQTAQKGLTFLSNQNATQEQKKAEFKKLLNESFDLDTIGRFALGRYWKDATPAQQKQYLDLFRKMVIDVYTSRFSDYKGQKFDVKSSRSVSGTDTMVTSYIVPVDGGENIQVDWRVRSKNNKMKIVDVYVAGVSMSVTQRSDFSAVIQSGGGSVDVLIDNLQQRTKK
ncbi:MAG: ABC transporter substrate-binding protein [Pseudobdellovibrionaceae bacterium]